MMMEDEEGLGSEANGDAIKRMFEAAKSGDWKEAAAAYKDLHVIVDEQLEGEEMEGEEGEEGEGEGKPKGKPLAAIIIGGPPHKMK